MIEDKLEGFRHSRFQRVDCEALRFSLQTTAAKSASDFPSQGRDILRSGLLRA